MNLENLTTEELLKTYQRLINRLQHYFTDRDANHKEKVKAELVKRLS